jgi:hypothetical protein
VVSSVTGGISASSGPAVCSEYSYCVEIIEVCRGIGGVLPFRDGRSISGFHSAALWNLGNSMFENNFGWYRSVLNTHVTFERISS